MGSGKANVKETTVYSRALKTYSLHVLFFYSKCSSFPSVSPCGLSSSYKYSWHVNLQLGASGCCPSEGPVYQTEKLSTYREKKHFKCTTLSPH